MSELSEFLSPYIERVELNNIIGTIVENRLKQGIRLYISHSKDIDILSEENTFEFSDCEHILSMDDTSFTYDYCGWDTADGVLSSPEYDTLFVLEDNGCNDVVLAHYKLKENTLADMIGWVRV